jgi:hypothetical protein
VGVAGACEYQLRATDRPGTLWSLGNFRIWFSGHGFWDLGSQLWGLGNFRIWFSGHGFQDMVFRTWDLNFGTWMWDLNFGTWISHRGFTVAFGHGHPLVTIMMVMEEQTYVFSKNFRSFDFESFWIFDRIVARTVQSLKLGVIKWEWEIS